MKMLKKGLLGCDLKHQVAAIGFLYSAFSVLALIFGFVLIQHPHYFADGALKANEEKENRLQANAIQQDIGNNNLDKIVEDIEDYYGSEETERLGETEYFDTYRGPIEGDDSLEKEEIEFPDTHRDPVEDNTTTNSTKNDDIEHEQKINPQGYAQRIESKGIKNKNEENADADPENTEEKADNKEVTTEEHFNPDAEIIGDSDQSEEENDQNDSNLAITTEISIQTELNEDLGRKDNTEDIDYEVPKDDNERSKREVDESERISIDNYKMGRNSSDLDEDENISDGRKHYNLLLKLIQREGVEAVVCSFLKLACSILLIMGVSKGKSWFLIPFLVEECLEMIAGLLQGMVSAAHSNWSVSGGFLFVLLYVLGGYCMYSVASYHGVLRRMNAHSREIISSVSQGGFQCGMNYQRLEEPCWQSQPNITSEFRTNGSGFVREKKVDMEDNDEHVLYVQ